jgi:hypothetical protein
MAARMENGNYRFRRFLKGSDLEPDDIDRRVEQITERVWVGIDCTACANCCRESRPTFSEEDVSRVARRLGMERQQFIDTYLQKSDAYEENPWQTCTKPCPFLQGNSPAYTRTVLAIAVIIHICTSQVSSRARCL